MTMQVVCSLIMLLVVSVVASECCAVDQRIEAGDLALVVESRDNAISISHQGNLVATDVAKSQLYSVGLDRQWKILLQGPLGAPDVTVGLREVKSVVSTEAGNARIETVVKLESDSTILITVKVNPPVVAQIVGLQIGVLSVFSDWMRGGQVSDGPLNDSTRWRKFPVNGRSDDSRILIKGKNEVALDGELLNVRVAEEKSDSGLSVADMRATPWDVKQTYLVYDSVRPLIPGRRYIRSYRVSISAGHPASGASVEVDPKPERTMRKWNLPELGKYVAESSGSNIPIRGQIIEMVKPALKDIALFHRYLDAVAAINGNTVIFYHDPVHVKLLRDKNRDDAWWTEKELRELVTYANGLGIRVIPGMWSKFNRAHFGTILSPGKGATFYCPGNSRAYDELFSLYNKLIEIYDPKQFLIGHDEIAGLENCPGQQGTTSAALVADISKIHDWMSRRNVRVLMWGDMLLASDRWNAIVGSAHGNDPKFGDVDSESVVQVLPRDIVIVDWHYEVHSKYPSIRYFKEQGFEVWGAAWYKVANAKNVANSIREYAGDGVMGTDWGFWSTLNPGTTSLAPIVAGGTGISNVLVGEQEFTAAFGSALRESVPAGSFSAVDISGMANTTASDEVANDGVGIADLGRAFDLSRFPRGNVELENVPFRVQSNKKGDDVAAVQCGVDNGKHKLPRTVSIPVDEPGIRHLAFLHAAYIEVPQNSPRTLGRYEIAYSDGTIEYTDIVENYNITDFRSVAGIRRNVWGVGIVVDELVGAYPAWKGISRNGMPLNVQTLVWNNPFPKKRVKSVTIKGDKVAGRCRIGLIGMSMDRR